MPKMIAGFALLVLLFLPAAFAQDPDDDWRSRALDRFALFNNCEPMTLLPVAVLGEKRKIELDKELLQSLVERRLQTSTAVQ